MQSDLWDDYSSMWLSRAEYTAIADKVAPHLWGFRVVSGKTIKTPTKAQAEAVKSHIETALRVPYRKQLLTAMLQERKNEGNINNAD